MPASGDLINFDIIENEKENIQSLPGGHSASALANIFSHSSLDKLPSPSDTKSLNAVMRQEFESELENISESDDPLDIFDRYVRWTLDAYPSAQATPSSQLLSLLERATKAFISSTQYKNDPRYLKLWLLYIHLVSDAPREAFAFLARHKIGECLALYYEEFAAWLEGAGRLKQAEEIYRMGIDKEASPTARLLRKFNEFQIRSAKIPVDNNEPSSPALPTVRPALKEKVDPFASVITINPQDPISISEAGSSSKNVRQKLQIFSDDDNAKNTSNCNGNTAGWQNISSLGQRKKENTIEPKSWVGETLKAGGGKSANKIPVFIDKFIALGLINTLVAFSNQSKPHFECPQITEPAKHQVTVNNKGKKERIFVNLESLYPTPEILGSEMSIEELRAKNRGWLSRPWKSEICNIMAIAESFKAKNRISEFSGVNHDKIRGLDENLVSDETAIVRQQNCDGRGKKMKIKEVNETQIIKAKLSSPSGPKIMKRKSKEPTMTIHTKAATDDIYDLFNQPLQAPGEDEKDDEDSSDYDDMTEGMTDGEYTSGCESLGTGRLIAVSDDEDNEYSSKLKNASEWTEFSPQKHVLNLQNKSQDAHITTITNSENENQILGHSGTSMLSTTNSMNISTKNESILLPTTSEVFEPPTQPYRDPIQVSHNRLPFMTPIAEKTESSIGIATTSQNEKNILNTMTPTKETFKLYNISPQPLENTRELSAEDISRLNIESNQAFTVTESISSELPHVKISSLIPAKIRKYATDYASNITKKCSIIKDTRCNPTDYTLQKSILACVHPPLKTYTGFFSHTDVSLGRTTEIKKYVKSRNKTHRKSGEKTNSQVAAPVLSFSETERHYVLKRELGAGTFAPIYLVQSISSNKKLEENQQNRSTMVNFKEDLCERRSLEALKMEYKPSAWEFYIIRQARYRLNTSRAAESVIQVYEMHLFKDESYLIEEYREQGTLLNIINIFKEDKSGSGVMEESIAMFFAVELFRTIEELHERGILHGDLKADNCLVRFDSLEENETWSSCYNRDGSGGWSKKGICLIDFGRGIDMYVFSPQVQFIADWESTPQDCAEIREMRPWTYQIDYYGLAGIIHSMLFGKYIDTVTDNRGSIGPGAKKIWRLRDNIKRYWQTEIWTEAFDLLLNAPSHVESEKDCRMPITRSLNTCRKKMETWLEVNTQRGVSLQAEIRKLENLLARKK